MESILIEKMTTEGRTKVSHWTIETTTTTVYCIVAYVETVENFPRGQKSWRNNTVVVDYSTLEHPFCQETLDTLN